MIMVTASLDIVMTDVNNGGSSRRVTCLVALAIKNVVY